MARHALSAQVLQGLRSDRQAALVERTGAPPLHADEDFNRLATCTPLQIWTG
jgi:hypothetical protein